MNKKQKNALHKDGRYCGYEELPNGDIKIAPIYAEQFEQIIAQKESAERLLESVTSHLHSLLAQSNEAGRKLWSRITDDYGLDTDAYDYAYRPQSKAIIRTPIKDKSE